MASSNNTSDAKMNRRGLTIMKAIIGARSKGIKLEVDWNYNNQPIRANGKKLKIYIVSIVWQTIPIICSNWKDEDLDPLKENIWDDIQMSFNVDESRRKFVLQEAGNLHRAFRSRLSTQFLRDKDGNINEEPPSQYAHIISKEDWIDFVAIRTGDARFLKLSNENRQSAKDPKYKYKASRKGYADIEDEIIQEAGPEVKRIKRHIVWRKARENKAGVIDNEDTQNVWNKCVELSQSGSEGEVQDFGRQDILAKAIGVTENPGSVRGVGFGVSQRDYFAPEGRSKQKSETKRWEALVGQLSEGLKNLEDKLKQKEDEERQPNFTSPSFKDSCTLASAINLPEGVSSCHLYLSNPTHRMVGKGKVYNQPVATLHTGPIPLNHVKVGVEVTIEGDAPLPVPIDDADLMTIKDAIGTYVARPISLVVVTNMAPAKSKEKGKVSRHTKESITTPVKKGVKSPSNPPAACSDNISLEYFNYLKIHMKKMKNDDQLDIEIEQNIFSDHIVDRIGVENIKEMINHEWLGASTIATYIRYLYEELLLPNERTRRFPFLSPHRTSIYGWGDSQATYIADCFATTVREYQPLFLAPCNVGNHWVLLAINPVEELVYYLDSLHGDPRNYPGLKNMFNNALQIYRASSGAKVSRAKATNIKWMQIERPRQANDIDCGYFVMRFMKEIILQNQVKIPMVYFPCYKSFTYSTAQISEVKEDWCRYIVEKFI